MLSIIYGVLRYAVLAVLVFAFFLAEITKYTISTTRNGLGEAFRVVIAQVRSRRLRVAISLLGQGEPFRVAISRGCAVRTFVLLRPRQEKRVKTPKYTTFTTRIEQNRTPP